MSFERPKCLLWDPRSTRQSIKISRRAFKNAKSPWTFSSYCEIIMGKFGSADICLWGNFDRYSKFCRDQFEKPLPSLIKYLEWNVREQTYSSSLFLTLSEHWKRKESDWPERILNSREVDTLHFPNLSESVSNNSLNSIWLQSKNRFVFSYSAESTLENDTN